MENKNSPDRVIKRREKVFRFEIAYKMTPYGVIRKKTVIAHHSQEAYEIAMKDRHPTYGRPPFSAWVLGYYKNESGVYCPLKGASETKPYYKTARRKNS